MGTYVGAGRTIGDFTTGAGRNISGNYAPVVGYVRPYGLSGTDDDEDSDDTGSVDTGGTDAGSGINAGGGFFEDVQGIFATGRNVIDTGQDILDTAQDIQHRFSGSDGAPIALPP